MVGRTLDWKEELGRWLKPFLGRLGHKARRQMCPLYVSGLIGPGDRKSIQPMAERLALGEYDQLHHFIAAGVWDAAPVETELLVQADKLVGGSDAVLVIDDTAIPKKGAHSVGVAPQYASALGKTANCQTLVSLTLARGEVPVMLVLRLFLPESWTSNRARLERLLVFRPNIEPRAPPQFWQRQVRCRSGQYCTHTAKSGKRIKGPGPHNLGTKVAAEPAHQLELRAPAGAAAVEGGGAPPPAGGPPQAGRGPGGRNANRNANDRGSRVPTERFLYLQVVLLHFMIVARDSRMIAITLAEQIDQWLRWRRESCEAAREFKTITASYSCMSLAGRKTAMKIAEKAQSNITGREQLAAGIGLAVIVTVGAAAAILIFWLS